MSTFDSDYYKSMTMIKYIYGSTF